MSHVHSQPQKSVVISLCRGWVATLPEVFSTRWIGVESQVLILKSAFKQFLSHICNWDYKNPNFYKSIHFLYILISMFAKIETTSVTSWPCSDLSVTMRSTPPRGAHISDNPNYIWWFGLGNGSCVWQPWCESHMRSIVGGLNHTSKSIVWFQIPSFWLIKPCRILVMWVKQCQKPFLCHHYQSIGGIKSPFTVISLWMLMTSFIHISWYSWCLVITIIIIIITIVITTYHHHYKSLSGIATSHSQ